MITCFAESAGAPGSEPLRQALPSLAVAVAQTGLQSKKLFQTGYAVFEHQGLYQRSILKVAFCLSALAKCSLPDGKSGMRWQISSACSVHDVWVLMHSTKNKQLIKLAFSVYRHVVLLFFHKDLNMIVMIGTSDWPRWLAEAWKILLLLLTHSCRILKASMKMALKFYSNWDLCRQCL